MIISKDYEDEQDDCVKRNLDGYKNNIKDPVTMQRLNILKAFSSGSEKLVSVGSGAFEPIFLNASHAIDIPLCTYHFLKAQCWKGEFFQCSCDGMPFADKFFDCAVCSEVIEHLPDIETVKKTFLEVARISKRFIFTTPTRDVKEPTHKFIFTDREIALFASLVNATVEKKGLFFYVHNGKRKIFN